MNPVISLLAVSVLALMGCEPTGGATVLVPTLGEMEIVVPRSDLPVVTQDANNNLSVIDHEGDLFLAFRTAPTHFASDEVQMHVLRSDDDGESWTHELTVDLDTDVREPQLVSHGGELRLYYAELGSSPSAFEPAGTWTQSRLAPAQWSDASAVFEPTFIPWRIRSVDGLLQVFGYSGGENIYDLDEREPIQVRWLQSEEGLSWEPVIPGHEVVLEGGGSETDAAFTEDGTLVAIVRNEAGDEDGFGSKVCTAPPESLGTWTCSSDPRKFDSPLVLQEGGRIWMVARRNLTADGHFDLGHDDAEAQTLFLRYQLDYWQQPKRCSLWEIDPESRTVRWEADLPGRGDTCFPDERPLGPGHWEIWNYSSALEGEEPSWLDGQNNPTFIYRMEVRFEEQASDALGT